MVLVASERHKIYHMCTYVSVCMCAEESVANFSTNTSKSWQAQTIIQISITVADVALCFPHTQK